LHLRAVAVLHYHEQLDDGQIASILDLDPQEVRQRLRRAEAELAAARPTTPGGV
jgi:DNA-directed RNA polymerase specialized sigma24 family protein